MKSKVKQAPKVQDEVKQSPTEVEETTADVQSEVEETTADVQSEVEETTADVQPESTKLEGDQIIIGIAGGLVVDKEYEVSSHTAQVLIDKGFATLKQ